MKKLSALLFLSLIGCNVPKAISKEKAETHVCEDLLVVVCVKAATCSEHTVLECLESSDEFYTKCIKHPEEEVSQCLFDVSNIKCNESLPISCMKMK